MRVLHVITGLGSGGAEAMLAKLVRAGGRHTHSVASLAGLGAGGAGLVEAGISVHPLDFDSGPGIVRGFGRLRNLIRRGEYDIVQGWLNHGNLAATLAHATSGSSASLLWNIRQSLMGGKYDNWRTRRIISINARLSNRPTVILYNSRAGAEQHEAAGYSRKKRHIIPNGFDTERFGPGRDRRERVRAELGMSQNEILIGLVARFDPWKNHRSFFEAAASLVADGRPVRFLFAGQGMEATNAELMRSIAHPQVMQDSLFLGQRSDIHALTAALDIACNASHGEGFPNAVGEAMACAVPCVVTDAGDCRDIVGDTGIVCEGRDSAALTAGLRTMIDLGEVQRTLLGERARARIIANFSLGEIVRRYDELYDVAASGEA